MTDHLGLGALLVVSTVCTTLAYGIYKTLPTPLSGLAVVVDGDTIRVGGHSVRLLGIDAPEMSQPCTSHDGTVFLCGEKAAYELRTLIAGRPVDCITRGRDTYGRYLATCSIAGQDLGRYLIVRGWAVSYGDFAFRYTDDERMAKAERAGIWATYFDQPSIWRHSQGTSKR